MQFNQSEDKNLLYKLYKHYYSEIMNVSQKVDQIAGHQY